MGFVLLKFINALCYLYTCQYYLLSLQLKSFKGVLDLYGIYQY